MDHTLTVARALPAVFAVLADPIGLSCWVADVADVSRDATAGRPATLDETFWLRLRDGDAAGDVIGYEPHWYVAYRLRTVDASHVLRVSCTARADGTTQVQIHQANCAPLDLDLTALHRALLDRT